MSGMAVKCVKNCISNMRVRFCRTKRDRNRPTIAARFAIGTLAPTDFRGLLRENLEAVFRFNLPSPMPENAENFGLQPVDC